MDHATRRPYSRPLLFLALAAATATAGCAVWRIGTSAELVRASKPFEAAPADATESLLVVGDSTAVGTGASSGDRSLAGLLAADNPKLRVVNKATDGARYEDFARQLQSSSGRFDTVLVLGGGNDVIRMTGSDKLRADIRRVAQLARERGTRVIMMPPGNVGNAPFFFAPVSWWMDSRSQQLHREVREAAQTFGAFYVGMYQDAKHDPFALNPGELHARDGLHPSDAGYALWRKELDRQAEL